MFRFIRIFIREAWSLRQAIRDVVSAALSGIHANMAVRDVAESFAQTLNSFGQHEYVGALGDFGALLIAISLAVYSVCGARRHIRALSDDLRAGKERKD